MRVFSRWDDARPGFVEMDLVAHCGDHLDGTFLSTLTLTDLATGWTECLPLLDKSAQAVLAALAQARMLFPFPLLGIDTDSGAEFPNEELVAYCEREQLTFTHGRPGAKNDQCHVEQKNGAVVRETVGCARLAGGQAYQQLREVYQVLRLVVNCFQPSLKLQAKVLKGERMRRVYDAAQTPLQWHQTSLGALRRYLRRKFRLTEVCSLTTESLRTWLSELSITPSARTGARRTVSTVAAYARSARAFCNWLVRQGYVAETPFPQDAVPKARQGLPRPVAPEAFVLLLRACQLTGSPGGPNVGMTARNRAILWLLLDTGLQVSELCRLRLADVDRADGTVTVRGNTGRHRIFPLSADGQRAVSAYLDQARLTPAWDPAVPEARDRLLLTERRHPLTKNSLTLLFKRLSQRAGFSRMPICPSMLRETYAIRFLQARGGLEALRERLGVADLVSVKRYQHFSEQRSQEREAQVCSEQSMFTWQSRRGKGKRWKEQGQGRGHRPPS